MHLNGTVVLRILIATDGTVERVAIASSTNPVFNNSAIEAVKQWRYKVFRVNGEPVELDTTATINYSLM